MWIASSLSNVLTPTAVALGNFDGVHRGHQQVIHPIFSHQLATVPV
ncbi:MAG: bifunctional riboflavin kinase/FAD synthetase, partial [Microcoleaceae cyanobacterium]